MLEVAERLDGGALVVLGDEQHLAGDVHCIEQGEGPLRLRRLPPLERVHDLDLASGGAHGEGTSQRETAHLLRGSLGVVARLGTVGDAATGPLR